MEQGSDRSPRALFDRAVSVPTPCRRPLPQFTPWPLRRPCTDWRQITLLYGRLIRIQPSLVVELNRAVAVAMCEGPEQGLRLIDRLLAREELANYYLAPSARADLCRRLGRLLEARDSYEKALAPLVRQEPERRLLAGRLREIEVKNWLGFRFFLCATTTLGASQIRDFYSLLDGSQSSILLPSGSLTHAKFP